MNESLIAVLGILASAICGGLVVYYWFKDTIESQKNKIQQWSDIAKDKRAIEVKLIGAEHLSKQLTKTNQSLSQELKQLKRDFELKESELAVEKSKAELYIQISLDQKREIDKYKTRRAKIKFTEQQNKEIISMRKRGYSFRVIASKLGISRETIRIHFNKLMEKQ